ncbi:MAG: flavodoxin-dependent (E)-4-hydroxy-3-methylbut-2-enyl-diphosphate synthase [Planctomycetaceae bacterium]|jgi:(E)-4-hydroxy-3-methylbut-2-enyl-diphosphate synthase|nr:flavodoxin-dependent (E)-4-hydroxy-3-methylbut-2-enyl-diphosphate synthase [Planctomycetaceae bacterium]
MGSGRIISIGSVQIGGGLPVALQSMAAVKTADVQAVADTCRHLADAGAAIIRLAVDTPADAKALKAIRKEIRKRTDVNLSVDLQENYRLAENVAPFVDKIRYNPGHLHHSEPETAWQTKVERIVQTAEKYDCALRIGVNCGSLDPALLNNSAINNSAGKTYVPALTSALQHSEFLDSLGFTRYCVSIKSSDPKTFTAVNRHFAAMRPDVPLHLGLTEAGLPPAGIQKSRLALEPLLADGIGDTLRVSLTVPNERKHEEIEAGRLIVQNAAAGNILTEEHWHVDTWNIISCPSCARVENDRFVQLAEQVHEAVQKLRQDLETDWKDAPLTIAVMGCRVNGPGETDRADIGLWCGKTSVNLKSGTELIGSFGYSEVIEEMLRLVRKVLLRHSLNRLSAAS